MNNTRLNIFVGHFGSGKTEIAINFAIHLKKYYNKVSIVDLDIVNPYFRTKDVTGILEHKGIKVIAPMFANTNVDIPALPAEIISLFQDKEYRVVFDVGGDDIGATALGRYYKYFANEKYQMFFVANMKRALTNNAGNTIELLREIEKKSRLKVSDLINNTNLSYSSTIEDLLKGQKVIEKIYREIKVPIRYITGKHEILSQLPHDLKEKAFPLRLYLKMPWE
jgi:hypothetical protein